MPPRGVDDRSVTVDDAGVGEAVEDRSLAPDPSRQRDVVVAEHRDQLTASGAHKGVVGGGDARVGRPVDHDEHLQGLVVLVQAAVDGFREVGIAVVCGNPEGYAGRSGHAHLEIVGGRAANLNKGGEAKASPPYPVPSMDRMDMGSPWMKVASVWARPALNLPYAPARMGTSVQAAPKRRLDQTKGLRAEQLQDLLRVLLSLRQHRDARLLKDLVLGELSHLRSHVDILDRRLRGSQVLRVGRQVVHRVAQTVLDRTELRRERRDRVDHAAERGQDAGGAEAQ